MENIQRAFWINNPYSKGSYSCPKPKQYTTIYGVNAEPELGGRLLFAGEHCSENFCGFMNGAIESSQKLLRFF